MLVVFNLWFLDMVSFSYLGKSLFYVGKLKMAHLVRTLAKEDFFFETCAFL